MNYKVGENPCIIAEVHNDYAIAKCDGMSLWIDKDTEKDFKKM